MNELILAAIGGVLIGLSATILLLFSGRITGISGILWSSFRGATGDKSWRLLFLASMVAGTALYHLATGAPSPAPSSNFALAIVSGLLVGIGTFIGSGCTSGHGVCGIGRLSIRSLAATCTFMLTAIIVVAALNLANL